jgi:sigma-B regulation protein RsbU (phosphoserine phosphatase)
MNPNSVRVLVVEDNPLDAALVRKMLQALAGPELSSFETTWVNTAGKGWDEIRAQRYDLLLLDHQLPDFTGVELLDRLNSLPANQQPAVIMLTASGSEEVAVEAMKRGAKDYLVKGGVEIPALTRAITTALTQKRLENQVARYHEQTAADLKMARELQMALLPHHFPSFPATAGPQDSVLRFHPIYIPATVLAGDFFDVFPLSDTEAGVFICDVMGHGVRAALVTAMMCVFEEHGRPVAKDPAQFMGLINRGLLEIFRQTDQLVMTTAFYLVIDLARRELRYAHAGHPPPLRLQLATGTVDRVAGELGPVLGLEEAVYTSGHLPLVGRELLVLFTDGLFEVTGNDGGQYGEERLASALHRRAALPAATLLDEIVGEVRAFAANREFSDDVCLLGVEIGEIAP